MPPPRRRRRRRRRRRCRCRRHRPARCRHRRHHRRRRRRHRSHGRPLSRRHRRRRRRRRRCTHQRHPVLHGDGPARQDHGLLPEGQLHRRLGLPAHRHRVRRPGRRAGVCTERASAEVREPAPPLACATPPLRPRRFCAMLPFRVALRVASLLAPWVPPFAPLLTRGCRPFACQGVARRGHRRLHAAQPTSSCSTSFLLDVLKEAACSR